MCLKKYLPPVNTGCVEKNRSKHPFPLQPITEMYIMDSAQNKRTVFSVDETLCVGCGICVDERKKNGKNLTAGK